MTGGARRSAAYLPRSSGRGLRKAGSSVIGRFDALPMSVAARFEIEEGVVGWDAGRTFYLLRHRVISTYQEFSRYETVHGVPTS